MNIKSSLVYAQDVSYVIGEGQAELALERCAYIKNNGIGDQQKDYHVHPLYEFHIVLKDAFQMMLADGSCYTVEQGSFIIIPYGVRHRIAWESEQFSKLLISFKLETGENSSFYSCFEKKLQRIAVYQMSDHMQLLAQTIVQQMNDKKQEYKTAAALYSCAFIVEAAQEVVGDQKIHPDGRWIDERVEKAADYIRKNITVRINAQDVADHISMSSRQLLRLFMKCHGCSTEEYIRREKIEYARMLLNETELPIAEVAEQLGFTGVSAFTNFYKRYEGITPSAFRKTKYIV